MPIVEGTEYNYRAHTSEIITGVILVDSSEVEGNNVTHYLNRIATICTDCEEDDYMRANQPQFLQKTAINQGDSIFSFHDPGELVIKHNAKVGDSWMFDEENWISATVGSIYLGDVFGVADSIKDINLSTGGFIRLSKNHGILKFRPTFDVYYHLVGLKNEIEIGQQMPVLSDFVEMEVGDIVEVFWRQKGYGSGGNVSTITYIVRGSITEIISEPLDLLIRIDGIRKNLITEVIDSVSNFGLTVGYMASVDLEIFANAYPNQYIEGEYSSAVMVFYEEDGIEKKEMLEYRPLNGYPEILVPPSSSGDFLIDLTWYNNLGYFIEFRDGLIEQVHDFLGRVHNGDTIGSFLPNSFYTPPRPDMEDYNWESFEEIRIDNEESGNFLDSEELILYPNPTNGKLNIYPGIYTITKFNIFTIEGDLIHTEPENFETVELSLLPSGTYILEFHTLEGKMTRRVVKE